MSAEPAAHATRPPRGILGRLAVMHDADDAERLVDLELQRTVYEAVVRVSAAPVPESLARFLR